MKIEFTHKLDLKRSMVFERLFHPNLRNDFRDKCALIGQQWIAVWMLVDGKLAGETYGMRLDDIPEDEMEDVPGCERYLGKNCLYVCSTAIMPDFQGEGFGRILKAYFLGCVREFPIILGHAFEGASLRLNKSFGALVGRSFPNWCDTGETAYLYELKQASLPYRIGQTLWPNQLTANFSKRRS